MKVTVIPFVTGSLGTVTKGLVPRLRDLKTTGQVETIQSTALQMSAIILRRVQDTWGDLLSVTPVEIHQLTLVESLQIAAQNNAIRTNHIKARIDKTQQNNRCRLRSDRDETINHIISKCSKLAQKEYKTRHDWVEKVIHWELCKKLKFDHTNKWYMHNPESVLENETHKLIWDFEIQTDHQILSRRPDLIIIKKERTCRIIDFAVPADHIVKLKESEKKDKYPDL